MLENLKTLIEENKSNFYRYSVYDNVNGEYFEHHFMPHSICSNIYSISKNVTSLALLTLFERGIISDEDYVIDYFKDRLPESYHENLPKIQIKHLLSQTSGIDEGILFENDRYYIAEKDWINLSLSRPYPNLPAVKFAYDNANYYLAATIAELKTGKSIQKILQENLFNDMYIHGHAVETCSQGHTFGASGIYLGIEHLSKIGQLMINGGSYNGKQLISKELIDKATTPFLDGGNYGYGFWLGNNGDYSCGGAHNQAIYVSKKHNKVVCIQGFDDTLKVIDMLREALEEKPLDIETLLMGK